MIPIYNNANYINTYIIKVYELFEKKHNSLLQELETNIKIVDSSLNFKKLLGLNVSSFHNLQSRYDNYKNSLKPISYKLSPAKKKNGKVGNNKQIHRHRIKIYDRTQTFEILKDFYDTVADLVGAELVETSGIKVCPYCNAEEISNLNKTTRRCEFDHHIAKDDYPILALSFYNLVPVCHTCNHKKSSHKHSIINPYSHKANEANFIFDYDFLTKHINFKESKQQFNSAAVSMNTLLHIESKHNTNLPSILLSINNRYDIHYLRMQRKYFNKHLKNNDEKNFIRDILINYGSDEDLLIYPFSKATKDIAKQFNLFQRIEDSRKSSFRLFLDTIIRRNNF